MWLQTIGLSVFIFVCSWLHEPCHRYDIFSGQVFLNLWLWNSFEICRACVCECMRRARECLLDVTRDSVIDYLFFGCESQFQFIGLVLFCSPFYFILKTNHQKWLILRQPPHTIQMTQYSAKQPHWHFYFAVCFDYLRCNNKNSTYIHIHKI